MPIDPYEALGLTKTATADDIKKAYRKMARANHPDLHPDDSGAEERFKAISGAYEVLKDPETRARYDAGEIDGLGAERPKRQYYREFSDAPENVYQQQRGFNPDADPADIFEEILRSRSRTSGDTEFRSRGFSASGPDLRYSLAVPFLDAVRGTETRITLPDGRSLAVKIPRGTEDGQTLRLRGKGAPGYGDGPSGDALITILVQPHPVFSREGDDILLTLPITIDEAIIGGKVKAPTIDGPVSLTIPPGASSGRILRLRGRGVAPSGKKKKGDQRVELKIVVPPKPDEGLRDFLTEWRKTHAFDPRSELLKGTGT
ncbi:MAG: J domain-containing protein [Hyphomicrobiales bacterium]